MKDPFSPKFFSLIKSGIPLEQVNSDILSGIVVGVVALPLSIAFAVASGVPPEKGIITAIVAGMIISVLGGSRVQIGGPTGAFIIIIYEIVQDYGIDGLFYSTIIGGVILILLGVLRLGILLKYIPHSLIVGFTSGIAVVIFFTQIRDALGLNIDKVPSDFIGKIVSYSEHMRTLNPFALAITLFTILILIAMKRITAKIPGSIIAILLTSAAVRLFQIPVTTIGTLYGEISGQLSLSLPGFPDSGIISYLQPGIVIALLGGIESLLSASVADGMISGHHRSNTELIAQGVANIVSPLFGGIPATGAIARTATNIKNGGRTPISGITHSVVLMLIFFSLGRFASLIPMSCLAGILIVVAYNMSEYSSFISLLKGNFYDRIILAVTFLLTVFIDLIAAIEVGVVLSSLLFMKRMADIADKRVEDFVDTDIIDDYSSLPSGTGLYEISGPLFFASAKRYAELLRETGEKNQLLIIRMRHVDFVDQTGMKNFFDTLDFLHRNGKTVILSGMNPDVRQKFMKNGIVRFCREENIVDRFKIAVERAMEISSS